MDDPDSVWVKTYRLLFDGFTNVIPLVFPRLDGLYRYFSAKRRAQHDAVYKLIDLLDGVADKKRSMLQDDSNSHNDVPEHEKDLLQLMLEAELRGEGNWTKKELRVSIELPKCAESILILLVVINSTIWPYSLLQVNQSNVV